MASKYPSCVLVCGGRDYTDLEHVWSVLDHYRREAGEFGCVIHGSARGADTLAADWARLRGVPELPFPVSPYDWETYGKRAGHMRNAQMLVEGKPDVVIAFPGGRGTADMIQQARAVNIPVLQIGHRTP